MSKMAEENIFLFVPNLIGEYTEVCVAAQR